MFQNACKLIAGLILLAGLLWFTSLARAPQSSAEADRGPGNPVAAAPEAALSTTTLNPDADTQVSSANGDANYGSDPTITVGNFYSTSTYRAFAHFDLVSVPNTALVQEAALRLYTYTTYGGFEYDMGVYRPQAAWDENTLTWNSKPTLTATGITTTVDSIAYWFTWDVTTLVQDWVDNGNNHGLALRAVDEGFESAHVFETREGTNPPQLVITYTLPNLAVDLFTYDGVTVTLDVPTGDQISLRVRNDGQAPVPTGYFIGLYVSTDGTITTGDTLLTGGRISGPALAVGQTVTVSVLSSVRVPAGYPPCSSYLGVIVDEADAISETNEGDNTAAQSVVVLPASSYTWTVNTTDDDLSPVSLRCALTYARAGDTIQFDPAVFPAGAPSTISLTSALPQISQGDLTIDGSGAGVILDGTNLPAGVPGLVLASDGNTVTGLQIRDMPSSGVSVLGDNNTIGSSGGAMGARLVAAGIAGPPAVPANVISGNGGHGVSIRGNGNVVQGNYIGTDATGTLADANGNDGVYVSGQGNRIGGSTAGQGNLISGNAWAGVELSLENATGNQIEGNYVGTDVNGANALPNQGNGVAIHSDARHNRVGGKEDRAGNLISANGGQGIYIGGTDHITVTGNLIGTDVDGTQRLGNTFIGIRIYEAYDNLIGGASSLTTGCGTPCNLVSGNGSNGILIEGAKSQSNRVLGNLVGLNMGGNAALSNSGSGVVIEDGAHDNEIGGAGSGEGNVISGNSTEHKAGVLLSGANVTNNVVLGNVIGLDAAGTAVVANYYGAELKDGPQQNRIGGVAAGEANTIAGNTSHGVYILGSDTSINNVRRNFIGTNESGQDYVGNGGAGVYITNGAHDNVIGDSGGKGNVIVKNSGAGVAINLAEKNKVVKNHIGLLENGTTMGNLSHGVYIYNVSPDNAVWENIITANSGDGIRVDGSGSLRNTLSRNSIYDNGGAGIENVNGGNTELAPPQWTGRRVAGGHWKLDGTTCSNCIVEIFSDSGAQARYFEAFVQADASGTFIANNVPRRAQAFRLTAIELAGNTSELGNTTMNVTVDGTGAMEVTQAVQDRNNSVVLIENKPTFVRFHVHSEAGSESASARLRGWRGGTFLGNVLAGNPTGEITILADPDRGQIDQSFWFRLPSGWLTSTLTLVAEVNHDRGLAESNYADNFGNAIVTFRYAPPMNILMVNACYTQTGTLYNVRRQDQNALASWLRRAYPINRLNDRLTSFVTCYNGQPSAARVNADLLWNQGQNVLRNNADPWERYYGMVDDSGGFVRGLAVAIPSTVATGPAGTSCCGGWDTDGSYADWYGGHELGHTYGLVHTQGTQPPPPACSAGCGCEAGSQVVYPNGDISPNRNEDAANTIYGFDIQSRTIYTPGWKSLMSYCPYEWMSDVAYTAIYTQMITEKPQAGARYAHPQSTGEYLAVFGSIVTATNQIELQHFYRIPDAWGWLERVPGTYSIRLLDSGGSTLADYPFTPRTSIVEEPAGYQSTQSASADVPALIAEFVPWVTGTARVSIYHGGAELISRVVSAHAPAVTVLSPNGGETLSASTATLSWSASDDDGDDLVFTVQYSVDGGAHWRALQPNITQNTIVISTSLLAGTTQGRIRVLASDGVNTAQDDSNADFSVPLKSPELQLIAPLGSTTYNHGQTVGFQAEAYDVEDGALGDAAFTWTSSLSGMLGSGRYLALSDLITGTHAITVTVTDSDGQQDQGTATVIIGIFSERIFLPLILKDWTLDKLPGQKTANLAKIGPPR